MAKRTATDLERALWETVMRDVRRFRAGPGRRQAPTAPPKSTDAPPALDLGQPRDSRQPGRAKPAPKPVPGNVDRATLERLKRGQVAIDGRIDLHGMTQAEAFEALLGFIDSSARNGRRKLLIITGKGPVAEGGGVLRRRVPDWLAAAPIGQRILAVAPAHPRHGGEGALYVMLRKPKP